MAPRRAHSIHALTKRCAKANVAHLAKKEAATGAASLVSLFVAAAAFAMLVVVVAIAIGIAATAAFIGKVAA